MQRLLKGAGIRQRENITWCDYEGRPSALATQRPLDSIKGVESGTFKASAKDVFFRDTDYFVAAELRNLYDVWDYILQGYYKRDEILKYIKHGVSVHDFFQPFKGEFKGKFYDSPSPPKIFLEIIRSVPNLRSSFLQLYWSAFKMDLCQFGERKASAIPHI